jgi:hypothetical protein
MCVARRPGNLFVICSGEAESDHRRFVGVHDPVVRASVRGIGSQLGVQVVQPGRARGNLDHEQRRGPQGTARIEVSLVEDDHVRLVALDLADPPVIGGGQDLYAWWSGVVQEPVDTANSQLVPPVRRTGKTSTASRHARSLSAHELVGALV